MSLCLNHRTLAPLSRAPNRMDEWLNSSEMIKQPFPTNAGMVVELVAKPMDPTIADSVPANRATSFSVWTCKSVVEAS